MLLDFMPLYVQLGFNFAADFYHYHMGSKYTQEIMLDPQKRLEQHEQEEIFIREKYPKYYEHRPLSVSPSLGIGVATIPRCWGCEVRFEPHMNPFAYALLSPDDDPMTLKKPNLDDSMQWLFEEIDVYTEMGYDKSRISLPDLQGPLNVAMKLVGDNRMLSLIARKKKADVVDSILEKSADIYIEVNKRLRKATDRPEKANWSVSGCTYYYLRPPQWERFIFPVIERCRRELGEGVRLHHCGEADEAKLETYSKIDWREIELGFGSDLKYARHHFINKKLGPVQISCRISPYRMLNQTAEQVQKDVQWILENVKGGPASISVVGCPYKTPEANLEALWSAVNDYNLSHADEDDED